MYDIPSPDVFYDIPGSQQYLNYIPIEKLREQIIAILYNTIIPIRNNTTHFSHTLPARSGSSVRDVIRKSPVRNGSITCIEGVQWLIPIDGLWHVIKHLTNKAGSAPHVGKLYDLV